MKRKVALFLLLLTALALSQRSDLEKKQLNAGGRERTYWVAAPAPAGHRLPLVLVFHGGGGNARQIARHTGFAELARQEGFVAVFPEGYRGNWNDGRQEVPSAAHQQNVDDLAFIQALLDRLQADYPIDPDRVFVTGISNGGIFSQFLAARLADRNRAAAPVVGGIPVPIADSFAPARPVSMLIIQGTADPLVPYRGGGIGFKAERGTIVSTERALELWRQADGCSGPGQTDALLDRDPKDGCKVFRTVWRGPRAEIDFYRVENGGHGWPGASQYLPRSVIGPVCQDFEATRTIWDFFRSR